MDKQKIFNLLIEEQAEVIKELESYIEKLAGVSDLDENAALDIDDYSRQTETMDMVNRTNQQLDKARVNKEKLEEYSAMDHVSVLPGAVVETEVRWYMVGVSILPFRTDDNKEVVGISLETPAYLAMRDKSKGDSITLGDKEYKILNIY